MERAFGGVTSGKPEDKLGIRGSNSELTKMFSNSNYSGEQITVNSLTPMSDQDRISPYNINTKLSKQVMRTKKNIN